MALRVETHEHVVLKARLRKATYENAAKEVLQGPKRANDDIVWAGQSSPDEFVIVRRHKDPFKKPLFFYTLARPHTHVYERVIVNRKNRSVAIDYMNMNVYHSTPFVQSRDLFYEGSSPLKPDREEKSKGMNFVRHIFWVNKLKAYLAEAKLTGAKMKYNSLFS